MKQKIFMLVAALCVAASTWAQDTPMVTLQNDTETKVFYGSDSFKDAMEVANHGDVVTLSSGIYNAPIITKAVAIFGAGANIATDSISTGLSQVNGDMYIRMDSLSGDPATGFYMEGLFFNDNKVWVDSPLKSASFVKCRFDNINFYKNDDSNTNTISEMVYFYQCRIAKKLHVGDCNAMSIYNSVINDLDGTTTASSMNILNSIVLRSYSTIYNTKFENCYFYSVTMSSSIVAASSFNSSCSVFNCASYDGSTFNNVVVKNNVWDNASNFFKGAGEYNTYKDTNTYELLDGAKSEYIGTDGKPIGLYGGTYSYNTIPSVPYVVKKDIATKSENGKLKVSIKVAVPGSNL